MFVLAEGLIPGIILGRRWWFVASYAASVGGVIVGFFLKRIGIFSGKMVV